MANVNFRMGRIISHSTLFMISSFLAIIVALSIDLIVLKIPLLSETRPNFSSTYNLRTLLIILGSALFVHAANLSAQYGEKKLSAIWRSEWQSWGTVQWFPDNSTESAYFSIFLQQIVVWALTILSVGIVLIFLEKPHFFWNLAREDHAVETLSAIIMLLNSALFASVAYILYRYGRYRKFLSALVALALSFGFFLIGMEEVSWFQRNLGLETPQILAANTQGELNFHNLATDEVENAYYFSMFLLLVLSRFIIDKFSLVESFPILESFTPSPSVAYAGSLFIAYNYDMWNILLTQIAFFMTFFILLDYLRISRQNGESGLLEFTLMAVLVFTQSIYFFSGDRLDHYSDVTEYKELLIPIACLLYALSIFFRTLQHKFRRVQPC